MNTNYSISCFVVLSAFLLQELFAVSAQGQTPTPNVYQRPGRPKDHQSDQYNQYRQYNARSWSPDHVPLQPPSAPKPDASARFTVPQKSSKKKQSTADGVGASPTASPAAQSPTPRIDDQRKPASSAEKKDTSDGKQPSPGADSPSASPKSASEDRSTSPSSAEKKELPRASSSPKPLASQPPR